MSESNEAHLNLAQIFIQRAERYREREALLYPQDGQYQFISWNRWLDCVKATSYGLNQLGVKSGDRIGLLSENRPEWTYVDFGSLSLGAAVVPIYPTSSYEDVLYILANSAAKLLFVSTQEHYDRLMNLVQDCATLEKIIIFDDFEGRVKEPVTLIADLIEQGRIAEKRDPTLYMSWVSSVLPDDLATLIYTSGTTGPPKGVMLSHKNFVSNYISASEVIPVNENDVSISFLPLSHVFERLAGYYFMAFCGAKIAYARSMKTVSEDIRLICPTVAAAVPRFYEKVHAAIIDKVESSPAWRKKIFYWAVGVGCQASRLKISGKSIPIGLSIKYGIAKLLVFGKLKSKLGGRIRFFISGGAPLSKELAEFFHAADILILEGYGLTETSPVIAVNSPESPRFGVVGKPLSVAEVKIANDGEILTRGDCVMKGYYHNEQATREVISEEGWFHTGDIGEIDAEGYLKITDRKKDIIVTSGGKNISPQNVENRVLADALFTQIVVVGDKRNYLVALIVPNRTEIEGFAKQHSLDCLNYAALLENPDVYAFVQKRLAEKTSALASYEQIKYFVLLPDEFTQEGGELTPTLKVKRKLVLHKYHDRVESLYKKGEKFKTTQ